MNKLTSAGLAILLLTSSTLTTAQPMPNKGGMQGMPMGQQGMGNCMGGMQRNGMSGMKQKRQKMHAEVMEIQQETDLAKRQAMMKEHMDKMQAMMMKRREAMMKKREAMQAEMMKITNEPDKDKRMAMLKEHMNKQSCGKRMMMNN